MQDLDVDPLNHIDSARGGEVDNAEEPGSSAARH